MISHTITKEHREDLVKALQQMVASVLEQLDSGQVVTLHTHHEGKPVGDVQCGPNDFLYTGWTFGVSVGDYPRRDPTVVNIKVTPDGIKVDYSDGDYPCCEAARRIERIPGDATTLVGGECPIHGITSFHGSATRPQPLTYEQRRDRHACKVCGNVPDEYGRLEHGRGCYTQSADGGGDEWIDMYGELR